MVSHETLLRGGESGRVFVVRGRSSHRGDDQVMVIVSWYMG